MQTPATEHTAARLSTQSTNAREDPEATEPRPGAVPTCGPPKEEEGWRSITEPQEDVGEEDAGEEELGADRLCGLPVVLQS